MCAFRLHTNLESSAVIIFFYVLVMYVTEIFLRVLYEKFITDKSFLTFSSTFLHTLSQYKYNLHVISCHFPAISETLRNLQTMDILIISNTPRTWP